MKEQYKTEEEAWDAWKNSGRSRAEGVLQTDLGFNVTYYYVAPKLGWQEFANRREVWGTVHYLCLQCCKYYRHRRPCCGEDTVMITSQEARNLGKLKGREKRIKALIASLMRQANEYNRGKGHRKVYVD